MALDAGKESAGDREPPVRIVLDTSLFTNPDSASQWGATCQEAINGFLKQAESVRSRIQFYMPPSVFEELNVFLSNETVSPAFEFHVALKAPNRYGTSVPGFLLYELIDDIRERINKGLRVAETAVREAHPANVEKIINRLRDKYRTALRAGILDSREDADLILLSLELEAALVSSDRGVVTWAEKIGIRLIRPDRLRSILETLENSGSGTDSS